MVVCLDGFPYQGFCVVFRWFPDGLGYRCFGLVLGVGGFGVVRVWSGQEPDVTF